MVTTRHLQGPAGLVLDGHHRTVSVDQQRVELSRREFDLLYVLLEERGRVVPFDEIGRRAWGHENSSADQRFIYTTAWRVRRALEAAGAPDVIEGVRGVGYIIFEDPAAGDAAGLEMFNVTADDPLELRAVVVFDPTDPNLRFSMVNEGATRLTGYSAAALTHLPELARRLWEEDERAEIDAVVADALASGEAHTVGRSLVRSDGTIVKVDISICRLEVPGRSPLAVAVGTLSADARPSVGAEMQEDGSWILPAEGHPDN